MPCDMSNCTINTGGTFDVCVSYPSPTRSVCKDKLVIPSTCIRERDIVIAPLVRVSVCLCVST